MTGNVLQLGPSSPRLLLLGLLLQLGCASAQRPAGPRPLAPVERSSVAAVLAHGSELGLGDDQIRRLEEIDRRLEKTNASLREELAQRRKQATSSSSGARPSGRAPGGMGGGGGAAGGGMGGGGGLGRGGRGMGRGGGGGGRGAPSAPESPVDSLERRLDENDTQAYLEAESVLGEDQRPPAQEIAGAYRAKLFDFRETSRGHDR